jgi:hypothetical protein
MFCEPVARITPAFGMTRQVERIPQRLRGGTALDDWGEIEDGNRNHAGLGVWLIPHGNVSSTGTPETRSRRIPKVDQSVF